MGERVTPEQLVEAALAAGPKRWSAPITSRSSPRVGGGGIQGGQAAGLVTGFVSNGNATPEVLEYLRPWLDLYKVDLKSFDDRRYRELGGRLEPILDSLRRIHELGFWLE